MHAPRSHTEKVLVVLSSALFAISLVATYAAMQPFLGQLNLPALPPALSLAPDTLEALVALVSLTGLVSCLVALSAVRRERFRRGRTERRLAMLMQVADRTGDLVAVVNRKGKVEYLNEAAEKITGFPRRELIGKRSIPWLPWYPDQQSFDTACIAAASGRPFLGEVLCRRRDGAPLLLLEQLSVLSGADGRSQRFVSTAADITHQRQMKDRLKFLDNYDPLTTVPNRRAFTELLQLALEEAAREQGLVSVLLMDIDRFRQINDLFGSATGDEVLRQIPVLLKPVLGDRDLVARLGSNEFGIIHRYDIQHLNTQPLAERIRTTLSRKMTIGERDIAFTVTLGIACQPDDGSDARTLARNADLALTRSKELGHNTIQFFTREIEDQIVHSYSLEQRLSGALRNSEYRLHFQPYCDLMTGTFVGAEALIRWDHGEGVTVSPAKFLPSLEESGMIIDVGAWVLRTACGQLREWKRTGRPYSISVNLSHNQFRHRGLVTLVAGMIRDMNIDPQRLTLELTETICIQDIDFAIAVLKKLKDTGVTLSIDDFGTGYSSLSYIKKLPVNILKIDQSFVREVTRDQDSVSIITAITTMARGIGLKTIAEGVESGQQRNVLHLLRCDMGQGFYFSPAVPADQLDSVASRQASDLSQTR
jgi:diguanylate cyclase (GGDEF)-like protein/PAS domain S-box-containing protein